MRFPAPSVCALLIGVSVSGAQTLLTVDDDLSADFASIDAAVAAAPEGSTILVRQGVYGAFSVTDKALSIVAEAGAYVYVFGSTNLSTLAAGKTLVLRGLNLTNNNVTEVLTVEDCAGTVWLEDLAVESTGAPFVPGEAAARIEDSVVVLSRCRIEPAPTTAPALVPPAALLARSSQLHLFETTVTGAPGGHDLASSGPGGAALVLEEGFLLAAASTLQGGQGGLAGNTLFGCSGQVSGGGGPGLVVSGGEAHLLGGALAGGSGGAALGSCTVGSQGQPVELSGGTLESVSWPAHGFSVTSPVRASAASSATFQGGAGELAWVIFSDSATALFLPQVLGTLVLDLPLGILPAGTLDPSGQARLPLAPALPSGAPSQRFLLQSLFLDPANGAFTLSTPSALVVLADGI